MGFPVIQIVLIAARQVSKPVADAVLRYGKDHPTFRTKCLIPIGRFLVNFTTRLRMKNLGLGESTTNVKVSEAAALEQASDFVQQVVIFGYSVTVFAGYYFYSKMTADDNAKDFEKVRKEIDDLTRIIEQNQTILEEVAKKTGVAFTPILKKKEEEAVQTISETDSVVKFPFISLKSIVGWTNKSTPSPSLSSIDELMLMILTEPV